MVLDNCISDSQSAFAPDRSSLDNAMAAIEIIHYMKSKVKGKLGMLPLSWILARPMIELIEAT